MANNPYVNKVEYGGTTLIDLTDATCTADKILQGYTAYGASGEKLVGTASGGGSVIPSDLPEDGKTRIHISIPDGDAHGRKITFCFYVNASSTVKVEWGDGNHTNYSTSGRKTSTHTYSAAGEYTLVITISAGSIYFGGSTSYTIYGSYNSSATIYQRRYVQWIVLGNGVTKLDTYALYYCTALQEIRFPSTGFTNIGQYAFSYCRGLKEVTIPNTVTSLGTYAFNNCTGLRKAVLPTNTTLKKIPDYCFQYCFCLEEITIPSQFNAVGTNAFENCYALKSISLPSTMTAVSASMLALNMSLAYLSIPSTVTSIAASSMSTLSCLQKLRFERSSPATVANSNAFSNLQSTCVISVPTGSLTAYTSAANYPSSSTYTYIEE